MNNREDRDRIFTLMMKMDATDQMQILARMYGLIENTDKWPFVARWVEESHVEL